MVAASIAARGPLSLAEFMRTALTHPTHGYYARADHAVFGATGDFVTSPEISPLFGELVAVWLVATMASHLPGAHPVQLVELGPGRGTLVAGVLRVLARSFPAAAARIGCVHLVESSPALRVVQAHALGTASGTESPSSSGASPPPPLLAPLDSTTITEFDTTQTMMSGASSIPGLTVRWHDRFADVLATPEQGAATISVRRDGAEGDSAAGADTAPSVAAGPLLILAHELFDALPVHQFVRLPAAAGGAAGTNGPSGGRWRERLVDLDSPPSPTDGARGLASPPSPTATGPCFRLVRSPSATPASAAYSSLLDDGVARGRRAAGGVGAVAPSPYVPPVHRDAASGGAITSASPPPPHPTSLTGSGGVEAAKTRDAPSPSSLDDGAVVEFSPAACGLVAEIAAALVRQGGAALIVDYGYDDAQSSMATGEG